MRLKFNFQTSDESQLITSSSFKTPRKLFDMGICLCNVCGKQCSIDYRYCKVCNTEVVIDIDHGR